MIINFFYGKDVAPEGDLENLIKKDDVATPKEEKTILQTALRLGFCASGLYVSKPKYFLKFSRQQVGFRNRYVFANFVTGSAEIIRCSQVFCQCRLSCVIMTP